MTFHKAFWGDLRSAWTFKAASDHTLFWKQIQIGWKYSHVTQRVSDGTNVSNVLSGRGLQRTKKIWDWVNVLDDVKLVSMINKYFFYFYHVLLFAKSTLTKNMSFSFKCRGMQTRDGNELQKEPTYWKVGAEAGLMLGMPTGWCFSNCILQNSVHMRSLD